MSITIKISMDGQIKSSQRRILMTKWVAQAWKDISKDLIETIIRSFGKCGNSVAQIDQKIMRLISEDWTITLYQV